MIDRNVDNVFAETDQVAFLPTNVVPGIDFSNDALLQGRRLSYLDTQKSRLGTTAFHQIPINAPKCRFANMQRAGMMQMMVPTGLEMALPAANRAAAPMRMPRRCSTGPGSSPTRGWYR